MIIRKLVNGSVKEIDTEIPALARPKNIDNKTLRSLVCNLMWEDLPHEEAAACTLMYINKLKHYAKKSEQASPQTDCLDLLKSTLEESLGF